MGEVKQVLVADDEENLRRVLKAQLQHDGYEVHSVDDGVERLLIAGHEPAWSTLVAWLIGGGNVRMPTAAVACLDLPHGEWTDLAPATCVLRWFIIPRALK